MKKSEFRAGEKTKRSATTATKAIAPAPAASAPPAEPAAPASPEPKGSEKLFSFTTTERLALESLVQQATASTARIRHEQARIEQLEGHINETVAEARARLGLPANAPLIPDTKRAAFVLVELAAPVVSDKAPDKVPEKPKE